MKPGLERVAGLLSLLAEPQTHYPIIHIAGTNGKGSTARIAAQLLNAHGLKAGLFTSPHLHHVEERYEVGGFPMNPQQFEDGVADLAPIVELFEDRAGEGVTYFEFTTALAFSWFAEQAVDVAVIETGLGGRLDASNAADATVAVVTTIGLEHTEYLGDTITAIAGEKLAILPEGAVLVTGDLDPEATAVASRVVEEQGSLWLRLGKEIVAEEVEKAIGGWLVSIKGVFDSYPDVFLGLHGRHQVDNLVTAVGAVEALLGRGLDPGAVLEAAAEVTVPGRMEVVAKNPLLMLDGAHNPPGMDALSSALGEEFSSIRWHIVFGAMADKAVEEMIASLLPFAIAFSTVAADSDRAMAASEVADLVRGFDEDMPVSHFESVEAGLAAARSSGDPVLVVGSLYVVGEARLALGLVGDGYHPGPSTQRGDEGGDRADVRDGEA